MNRAWIRVGLAIAVLGIPALGFSGPGEKTPPKVPAIGDKAPGFSLPDFSGKPFVFSDANKGGAVLLWFTNLCERCRSKFGEMEALNAEYGGKGVEIAAVPQLGKDRKTVEEAIRANHLKTRFLYDPDGSVTSLYSGAFDAGTCPLTNLFLIDPAGVIVYATHYPGASKEEIASALMKARSQSAAGSVSAARGK